MDIRELIKNPFVAFLAGLLMLWLVFKLLHVVLSFSWLFVLAFVVLFVFNERFRESVRIFFQALFNR